MKRAALFAIFSATMRAQVGPPLLGYLPDNGRLRPVYGIAAAAGVGGALDYGRTFAVIAVSPQQDFALASDSSTGQVLLVTQTGVAALPQAAPSPDRIVMSPRGSAALLWFSATNRMQIVSGLPASPSLREIDANFLLASPDALAIADDGTLAAGAWRDGLYLFGPNGEVSRTPLHERAYVLAFYAGSHDLAAGTRLHLFTVSNGAASAVYEGALKPAGLAMAANNQRILLAESSGSILSLDLARRSVFRADCACEPEGLFGMGPSLFRLSRFDGTTFKLFDARTGDVLFVPLAAAGQGDAR